MKVEQGTIIEHTDGSVELRDWTLGNFHWPPTDDEVYDLRQAIDQALWRVKVTDCYCTGDTRLESMQRRT